MKKIYTRYNSLWSSILIVLVIFAAFVLPLLPVKWQGLIFRTVYSLIYILAVLSLEKRGNRLLTLFFTTFLLEWISSIFNLEIIHIISRSANVIFFLVIVALLIRQIAQSKEVTASVIMDSITGYLLLGLVYSIFITIIIEKSPGSYSNIPVDMVQQNGVDASVPLYYSFVTIASLGYGDICPVKPLSRSLATFIAVSGQFYMAVIVALLVGKFSSQRGAK